MKCPNCGTENPVTGKFCVNCAAPLQAAAPAPPPAPIPPPTPPPAPVLPPVVPVAPPPASPPPLVPPVASAAAPPPAQPPPLAPTPGAPPPPPRGGMGPALYGLIGFLGLALVGGLIWFLVLRPKPQEDKGCALSNAVSSCIQPEPTGSPTVPPSPSPSLTIPPTTPPTTSPTPTIQPTTTTPPPSPSPSPSPSDIPPPPNGGKLGFIASACSSVTRANECKGFAFNRHAGEAGFSIRLIIYNAPAGKAADLGLVNPRTGAAIVDTNRFMTDGHRIMIFVVNITASGGMPVMDGEITVRYAGKPIRFNDPPVIRWR